MKRIIFDVLAVVVFVLAGTYIVYGYFAGFPTFWESQRAWSVILMILWAMVTLGYFHQGWLVYKGESSEHVSVVLPVVVFLVQCVLFVKGIFYSDWSLIAGALMVNSGVTFSLYQILKTKKNKVFILFR